MLKCTASGCEKLLQVAGSLVWFGFGRLAWGFGEFCVGLMVLGFIYIYVYKDPLPHAS